MKIRIAGTVGESIVDGPGFRYTVFTQGCPHGCKGCHNPHTHDYSGGFTADTDDILEEIKKDPLLDGVTFSGGEPFSQCVPLADLGRKIKAIDGGRLNIISYTGYTFEYLLENAEKIDGCKELMNVVDYLVDGRFIEEQRSLELKFRGSKNQRFIDMKSSLAAGKAIEFTDL